MDPARTYINTVMARMATLGSEVPFKVGGLTWDENSRPPIIHWRYGDITHEDPPDKTDTIFTEVQSLWVKVWHVGSDRDANESEENTRTLKNNLLVAARLVAQETFPPDTKAPPMTPGTFEWNEEAHMKTGAGRSLVGTIDVRLPVAGQVFEIVTIIAAEHIGEFQDPNAPQVVEQLWDITIPIPIPPPTP